MIDKTSQPGAWSREIRRLQELNRDRFRVIGDALRVYGTGEWQDWNEAETSRQRWALRAERAAEIARRKAKRMRP